MNIDNNTNYLTNSVAAAKQFAQNVAAKISANVRRTPWGTYESNVGSIGENVAQQLRNVKQAAYVRQGQGVFPSGRYSDVSSQKIYNKPSGVNIAASIPADILTNDTRRDLWRYTNMHRLVGDVGKHVGARLGLDSSVAGAITAAAVPIGISALSGQTGSLLQGLRPKGQKAVAPVTKEEDPTGATTRSIPLEIAMRYGLGQRGQILPYQAFKQERPDIAPSTYSQYKRYQNLKPDPGKNVIIDPESQSFSVLNGVIRGTAKGLNDPEIRLKGVPVTLSSVLGTAAGLGAIKGFKKAIEPAPLNLSPGMSIAAARKLNPPGLGEKVGIALGQYADPVAMAAGATAALTIGYATKKLLQMSADRRLKKENPVEYLKHKHGTLEQASAALGQQPARSWQQLVPYI